MTDATCNASIPGYQTRPAADVLRAFIRRSGTWLRSLPRRVFGTLVELQRRAGERARVRNLDDRLLDDIGLTRADLDAEAQKPFWTA